jgi:hypothetical protein
MGGNERPVALAGSLSSTAVEERVGREEAL